MRRQDSAGFFLNELCHFFDILVNEKKYSLKQLKNQRENVSIIISKDIIESEVYVMAAIKEFLDGIFGEGFDWSLDGIIAAIMELFDQIYSILIALTKNGELPY